MKRTVYILALTLAIASCNNARTSSGQITDEQKQEPAAPLYDTHWKLAELGGKPIVVDSAFNKEPYLVFVEKDHRAEGNAGCNGFGGTIELEGQEGIKISRINATMMACPNLEVEQRFLDAMRNTNSYKIIGDTLILYSANKSPLAKLGKAVK